jgi:hypothetical protein
MSSKKFLVGAVGLALLCGVVYGVFGASEKKGDLGGDSVAESTTIGEIDDAAPVAHESSDAAVKDQLTAEEPILEEEFIMSTSAGVAKRAKLAETLASGNEGSETGDSVDSVPPE